MIDTLYRFAKFQYECGNYSGAAEYLYFVRVLVCLSVDTNENDIHFNIVESVNFSCRQPTRNT